MNVQDQEQRLTARRRTQAPIENNFMNQNVSAKVFSRSEVKKFVYVTDEQNGDW